MRDQFFDCRPGPPRWTHSTTLPRKKGHRSDRGAGRHRHPAIGPLPFARNIGYPKLREHLGAVVAYMTMSKGYFDFVDKLDTYRPRFGEQYRLPFTCEPDHDDGKGL